MFATSRALRARMVLGSRISSPIRPVQETRRKGSLLNRYCEICLPAGARGVSATRFAPEYEWIDGVERLENYRPGGFHPVQIGDVWDGRYQVMAKLGHGGWSTVWLARDTKKEQYVAVKVGMADSLPDEVPIMRALHQNGSPSAGSEAIPCVFAEFRITGPNGSHLCYTTAVALGNLRSVSFSVLFSLEVTRSMAYELVLAVAFMHTRGYAHGGM